MVRALTRVILFVFIALQLNAPLMHAHVAGDGGIAGVHFHPESVAPTSTRKITKAVTATGIPAITISPRLSR